MAFGAVLPRPWRPAVVRERERSACSLASLCPAPCTRRPRRGALAVRAAFVEGRDGRLVNFYTLLGCPRNATTAEVKTAYRQLSKLCHPDVCGLDGNDLCALLNDAYSTLRDPSLRLAYDSELQQMEVDLEEGFDAAATRSKWRGSEAEQRAVFVDENTCIGCKQCVWAAPAMFRLENTWGRSQVWAQWLNSEEQIATAIDACPVRCIHWVQREQLPVLEHVMATLPRVNVGIMAAGQGGAVADVFAASATFVKQRAEATRKREAQREERRAAEAAAASAEAAGQAGRRAGSSRTEERDVGGIMARWSAATGWRWDPAELLGGGRSIPQQRALVPAYVDGRASRRRLTAEVVEEARRAGLLDRL